MLNHINEQQYKKHEQAASWERKYIQIYAQYICTVNYSVYMQGVPDNVYSTSLFFPFPFSSLCFVY